MTEPTSCPEPDVTLSRPAATPEGPPVETMVSAAGRRLAYRRRAATAASAGKPGVVFLCGFRSDMSGTKAEALDAWCAETGRAFLRFDYSGHGISDGDFEDGCIGDWADDAHALVTALTDGPQVLVGSSMGGWISLLLIKRLQAELGRDAAAARIAGFVGLAAAPDFTEDSMWASFDAAQRAALTEAGRVDLPNDYSDEPYVITAKLIEDGRRQLVLRSPLPIDAPVRLLHGTADADVKTAVALRLLDHLESPDARLLLIKDADHRLSEPRDLALLTETVAAL